MDWNRGYSAAYYISVVDRSTWRDIRRIEITGGSIKRSLSGLRESADVDTVGYSENREQIVRIWLDARQESSSSHVALFTGLATSPDDRINGSLITNKLQCYSILKIAEDVLLPKGWYAPSGMVGSNLAENLLKVIGTPITVAPDSPSLTDPIIAESGENNLSMAQKILYAINWDLKLNGKGEIYIGPYVKEPVSIFDSMDNDVIEPSLDVIHDWYNCPNVFRAVAGDASAEARDDSPDSIFSTVNRGREIWVEESSCSLNDGETLAQYAARRLKEEQHVATTISYSRRFNPDIYTNDVITLNYPSHGIGGNYLITSQSIDLTYGTKTSEEVVKI